MATLSRSESRRLYSWWWDSHISPRNSKWLQDNLTDIDTKVKAMIRLIEEDADSFARRAEMYYKKRPELMSLVEEFYRAYRALAEKYDHATAELRQAHRTIVEVFPEQCQSETGKYLNSENSGRNMRSPGVPRSMKFLFDSALQDDSLGRSPSTKNDGNVVQKSQGPEPSKLSKGAENGSPPSLEVIVLEKILLEIQAEKESLAQRFHESMQQLFFLESELKDVGGLDEQSSRSDVEIKVLKETFLKLKADRDVNLERYNNVSKKCSSLKDYISHSERSSNVKSEGSSHLEEQLSILEAERDACLYQCNESLEMFRILEDQIFKGEESALLLFNQTEKTQAEVESLKLALSQMSAEKKNIELQYEICLRRVTQLESESSQAYNDVTRLSAEVFSGASKLRSVEEQYSLLVSSNLSLQSIAEELTEKIQMMDRDVIQKGNDVEKLRMLLQEEKSKFSQIEAALGSLQKLHLNSQEEQKAMANELEKNVQIVKDLEMCKNELECNFQRANQENQNLLKLAETIQLMDHDLIQKGNDVETLQMLLQDEKSKSSQLEAALVSLQKLHLNSQEEQKAMADELAKKVQMLKDLEMFNNELECNFQKATEENQNLLKLTETVETMNRDLIQKGNDVETLQTLLQDEKSKCSQVEVALVSLQKLHFNSQEKQKGMADELETKVQMLKDLEMCNNELVCNFQRANEENQNLLKLTEKIQIMDQDLVQKGNDIKTLQMLLQDEKSKCSEVEAALVSLQKLHFNFQEQKGMANELEKKVQMLKDLEMCNNELECNFQRATEENQNLLKLTEKIQMMDQDLIQKGNDIETLETLLRDEKSKCSQLEAALVSLQKLHCNSQEEQKAMANELEKKVQMLKDLEMCNIELECNFQRAGEENQNLLKLTEKMDQDLIQKGNDVETLQKLLQDEKSKCSQVEAVLGSLQKLHLDFQEEQRVMANELEQKVQMLKDLEMCNNELECNFQRANAENHNLLKLTEKMQMMDQELIQKENDVEKLQMRLQEEKSKCSQVEAALGSLEKLHYNFQEEQKAMANELEKKVQMLKDLEMCNNDLECNFQRANEENQNLLKLSSQSEAVVLNLKNDLLGLSELKQRLELDLAFQLEQSNSLHQETLHLKQGIAKSNRRYQTVMEELCSVGLDAETAAASVRSMQDKNLKLEAICKKENDEKNVLQEKLKEMEHVFEKNIALENLLTELQSNIQSSGEKIRELQESCLALEGENSVFVSEKTVLLSQLQTMANNMQTLSEKNALVDDSLALANIELEGLRVKTKDLEEFCHFLKEEKTILLNERNDLLAQLQIVEFSLSNLGTRITQLEEKCFDLEKNRDITLLQVKELQVCLDMEKQQREIHAHSSAIRLVHLENEINWLQEQRMLNKKELEEEHSKGLNAQIEIFVLQNVIEELEQKNLSLLYECHHHEETSKLSKKMISEIETENLEQQVEIEFLLDETDKLQMGLRQMFKTLQSTPAMNQGQKLVVDCSGDILDAIKTLTCSLQKTEDEKQHLTLENAILLTFVDQKNQEASETEMAKHDLLNETSWLRRNKCDLMDANRKLKLETDLREEQLEAMAAELDYQNLNLASIQNSYHECHEELMKSVEQNRSFLRDFERLSNENEKLEHEHESVMQEAAALSILSLHLAHIRFEKLAEFKSVYDHLSRLNTSNTDLKRKIKMLGQLLESEESVTKKFNEKFRNLQQKLCVVGALSEETLIQEEQKLQVAEDFPIDYCNSSDYLETDYASSCNPADISGSETQSPTVSQEKEVSLFLELAENSTEKEPESKVPDGNVEDSESKVGTPRRTKEENVAVELQEMVSEELWQPESSPYFAPLVDNKVNELASLCEHLEELNIEKSVKIEYLKDRVVTLETELDQLKAKLLPSASTTQSPFTNGDTAEGEKEKFSSTQELDHSGHEEDGRWTFGGGSCNLAAESAMSEVAEKAIAEQVDDKQEDEIVATSDSKFEVHEQWNQTARNSEEPMSSFLLGSKDEEIRPVIQMKDIQLDQTPDCSTCVREGIEQTETLELWDPINREFTTHQVIHSSRRRPGPIPLSRSRRSAPKVQRQTSWNAVVLPQVEKELGVDRFEVPRSSVQEDSDERPTKKVMDRLEADAKKLLAIHMGAQELMKRLEMKKMGKKISVTESERAKRRLADVDETVLHLFGSTNQLARDLQMGCSSGDENGAATQKAVTERAVKASEMIHCLQFELESIRYTVLQLENDSKSKGKQRFPGSKTGLLLKQFIYSSGRRNRKQKKDCFCGYTRFSEEETAMLV